MAAHALEHYAAMKGDELHTQDDMGGSQTRAAEREKPESKDCVTPLIRCSEKTFRDRPAETGVAGGGYGHRGPA